METACPVMIGGTPSYLALVYKRLDGDPDACAALSLVRRKAGDQLSDDAPHDNID